MGGCTRLENIPPQLERSRPRPFRFMPYAAPPVSTGAFQSTRFVDVAAAAGLHYAWPIPEKRPLNILQTIGYGCAFLDYDNDNHLDILLVGKKLALFRGDGKGRFTDVSAAVGLSGLSGHFLGCAVGDVDNDGFVDIYISGYRTARLLHNEAADREKQDAPFLPSRLFRDITRSSSLMPLPWGTSCVFAETLPGSGRLDLYVANYVDFRPEVGPELCLEHGVKTACEPQRYNPLKGVLYRNNGNGRFTNITVASGASDVAGKGLGVAYADFDNSGRPGIAIANDEMPGDLLQGIGNGTIPKFVNVGVSSGTAYDRDGNLHAGMGLDWGDYNNDGLLDLFVTTFSYEPRSLYRNQGKGVFSDQGIQTGLARTSMPYVAFGCKFFDYDNDGWLDLIVANGHVQDNINTIDSHQTYRQPTQLFRNIGGKYPAFEDVSGNSTDLMRPIVGRGLAVGDYDNDGRMDALVVDAEGKPLLLRNESKKIGHWLGIRLKGTKSNTNGYGAMLTATVGGRTLRRLCHPGGSYLSSSDPRVHFGLGNAIRVDKLTIHWPSGRVNTYRNLSVNRYITLQER